VHDAVSHSQVSCFLVDVVVVGVTMSSSSLSLLGCRHCGRDGEGNKLSMTFSELIVIDIR